MATSRTQLKQWFQRGLKPLQEQFAAWIDSYWHKDDAITTDDIDETTSNQYNRQADWNQDDSAEPDFIKNKPAASPNIINQGSFVYYTDDDHDITKDGTIKQGLNLSTGAFETYRKASGTWQKIGSK